MNTFKQHARAAGFTIVELLVIVAVIAILAGISIVSYSAITSNSREQALTADLQTVNSELTKYKAENGGYPTPALFTSEVTKTNTSGQTTYTYGYNSTTGVYCLRASGFGKNFYLTSKNSKVIEGACPVGY